MLKKFRALLIVPMLSLSLFSENAVSDVITLHVPVVEESTQQHLFYHELLETAIKEIGHTPKLITTILPQLRVKNYLDHGLISIYWMIESDERNDVFADHTCIQESGFKSLNEGDRATFDVGQNNKWSNVINIVKV